MYKRQVDYRVCGYWLPQEKETIGVVTVVQLSAGSIYVVARGTFFPGQVTGVGLTKPTVSVYTDPTDVPE